MKYRKIAKITAIGMTAILGGALLAGCTTGKQLEQAQADLADAKADVNDLNSQVAEVNAKLTQAEGGSAGLEAEKAQLQAQLEQYKLDLDAKDKELLEDAKTAVESTDLESSYDFDDLEINEVFEKTLADPKLDYLFDGDLTWDKDDYSAYETLYVKGKVVVNGDDFKGNPYLALEEEGVIYQFVLDDDLDTSQIDEDETLKFSFLGEAVEVTSWDGDSVTFLKGNEHFMKEAEAVDVNGKNVELFVIGENYAYVKVDGQGKKVYEGETETVNGLEVYVSEVVETTSWRAGGATVRLGNKVSETIDDGDEWAKDSPWEWTVSSNSLGLKLVENFVTVSEDDDFKALGEGESLALPNGFTKVLFAGFENPKYDEVKASLATKENQQYVKLKGDFESGFDKYDTLYVNASGFYDKDLELVSESSVELRNKELQLSLDEDQLVLGSLKLKLDFTGLSDGEEDLSDKEEDWLTSYGVKVKATEDTFEDGKVTLEVPDEVVTAKVQVGK